MISLFRKCIASRLAVRAAVSTGVLACLALAGAPGARAQAPTRMQLASQREQGVLSLTVDVNDVQGDPVSGGSVSFESSKGSLGSAFVRNGVAALNLTNAPAWIRNVTAVYHGDADFAPASAATQVAAADDASTVAGFTVTAVPTSFTVAPGDSQNIALTITSNNGFTGQVNLSCSGLINATLGCNFTPSVVTPAANGTASSSLQITTEAPSGVLTSRAVSPWRRSTTAWAFVFPGILALAGIGAIRRRNYGALRVLGLALLLSAGALGLTACNARYSYEHYQPAPNYGTPAGNYTVVISAYSSNGTSITNATTTDASCTTTAAVCLNMTVK